MLTAPGVTTGYTESGKVVTTVEDTSKTFHATIWNT